ncbi:ficolin-3-like [Anastrepha obliqua]|uniref:ficolin-3-like n=1 Tax=Anastrepha obliqua TaxID=95512 RepID=UPI002409D639|nr:ficolin-3-like [Anastrepha obliqua]
MQRLDGSVAFHNRTWDSYKTGFGSISQTSEFFLSLQHLHELTVNDYFELCIDLEDFNGVENYTQYSDFNVLGENTAYKLGI